MVIQHLHGVPLKTSLMSSSLLFQQCPVCLVCLIWIVLEMGFRWPYSRCFVGCCSKDLFNIARNFLVKLPSSFFSIRLVSVNVVHLYSSMDTIAAWKNCEFLQHSLEQAAGGIDLDVNADKMEYMFFNKKENISTRNGGSLKLVDKFTYLGSSLSSTENDINMHQAKAGTAIEKLLIIYIYIHYSCLYTLSAPSIYIYIYI